MKVIITYSAHESCMRDMVGMVPTRSSWGWERVTEIIVVHPYSGVLGGQNAEYRTPRLDVPAGILINMMEVPFSFSQGLPLLEIKPDDLCFMDASMDPRAAWALCVATENGTKCPVYDVSDGRLGRIGG